jgi:hypothetical protein
MLLLNYVNEKIVATENGYDGLATLNCTEKKRSWYTSRYKKEGENHGRKTSTADI